MPRSGDRGGADTRARIAETASGMFAERGFDAVTVAEVARASGVSSVTVFKHFPRKEDLFFDRTLDAEELLRATIRDRAEGVGVLDALERAAHGLVEDRAPLSGLDGRAVPFLRTVDGSPSLRARALELAAGLRRLLAEEVRADARFGGDPELLAALVIAGYSTVFVATARRMLSGDAVDDALVADHRARLGAMFAALRSGITG